jgi:hypothetical protein
MAEIMIKRPRSREAYAAMMPEFFNTIKAVAKDSFVMQKIASGNMKCIALGEDKFQQDFGGYIPASNEFGVAPLRPQFLGKNDNLFEWTDGENDSSAWAAADTFLAQKVCDNDELLYIYGYFNHEPKPNTLEMQITVGDRTLPVWNLEQMRLMDQRFFIFPEPIIVEPMSQISIAVSTRSKGGQVTEEAGLLGNIYAPSAKLTKRVLA